MKKFILTSLIIMIIVPLVTGAANPTELEKQIDQVRREREVLIEEQKKLQAELEATNRESQTLGTAVKSLDATRKKLSSDISITQSKIASASLTILSLENTMSEKEQQIIVHRRAIADTLATLSEYDTRPFVFYLLASVYFSDLWRDQSQLAGLSGRLEEEVNALRETRKVLNQEKEQRIKVKEAQESLKSQLSGQKSVVEENQKAKERLLTETKNKEVEYQKLLADNLQRQKEFEEDLFRLESELRITLDPSLIPVPRHGVLAWPLSKIYVTQNFGRTSSSGRLYASGTHNGVDFRATQGTPIMAMASGVVEGAGNTDDQRGCYSYGRWVFIRHNNGLSSIYAHMSASIVKVGQDIRGGEIIGYSGGQPGVNGSGHSTGPHLHVGLFASQGVSIGSFTSQRYLDTGSGCHNVSIPLADPRAYLDALAYLPAI